MISPLRNPRQRLGNLAASLALLISVGAFYAAVPYFRRFYSRPVDFLGGERPFSEVLAGAAVLYALLLAAFYLFEPSPHVSKSVSCLRALRRLVLAPRGVWQGGLSRYERLGLLSVLLKGFFAPLMLSSLLHYGDQMLLHARLLLSAWREPGADALTLFDEHGFWLVFMLIFTIDVLFFALGYLTDLPALKNEIRSVDPTLLGWGAALACYPPFSLATAMIFGGRFYEEFPRFEAAAVHVLANGVLLALLTVYAWAAVALNFKASNLCHRGIVSCGPYRFVRHPSYASKNLAWWIGMIPPIHAAAQTSAFTALAMAGSMLGWSIIYYMRALTEEDHLRSVDGDYDTYCQKVSYRFIPGVV